MIRYADALNNLEAQINAISGTWYSRANDKLNECISKNKYVDQGALWSEIKPFYMRCQNHKCGYCEENLGLVTNPSDVEHFRPKTKVIDWHPKQHSSLPDDIPTGGESTSGYFHLAYHPHNYLLSCKHCNTSRKDNYFPVASTRLSGLLTPNEYLPEEAYLIYPLGTVDEDPERLIKFVGKDAVPAYQPTENESKWQRATVIIELLALNREDLLLKRAEWILGVARCFRDVKAGGSPEKDLIDLEKGQFTSCTRCFIYLLRHYPTEATRIEDDCRQFKDNMRIDKRT